MKQSEFIGELFLARDIAHSTHLSTRSYAKHMALGGFYEALPGLADAFAEAYQGEFGLFGKVQLQSVKQPGNIVSFLQGQKKEFETARDKICNGSRTLENIFDEILGLYLSTLYKLQFLA